MGKGGIYGKRKKQLRPKSFKEESGGETSTGKKKSEAVSRYGTYTITQGYDTALSTTKRRRYERKRGNK